MKKNTWQMIAIWLIIIILLFLIVVNIKNQNKFIKNSDNKNITTNIGNWEIITSSILNNDKTNENPSEKSSTILTINDK